MAYGGSAVLDYGPFELISDENARSSFGAEEFGASAKRSDPSAKSGMLRPFSNICGQQEEHPRDDVISAVEKCMNKHAYSLLQSLEGITGRLSQLESYCHKLEKSIGDLRSDMIQDRSGNDKQLESLEKHLQESLDKHLQETLQILRDKQKLSETQKELAELQSVPKESITSLKNDDSVAPSVSEPKRHDKALAMSNQCLRTSSEQSQLYNETNQTGELYQPSNSPGLQAQQFMAG